MILETDDCLHPTHGREINTNDADSTAVEVEVVASTPVNLPGGAKPRNSAMITSPLGGNLQAQRNVRCFALLVSVNGLACGAIGHAVAQYVVLGGGSSADLGVSAIVCSIATVVMSGPITVTSVSEVALHGAPWRHP